MDRTGVERPQAARESGHAIISDGYDQAGKMAAVALQTGQVIFSRGLRIGVPLAKLTKQAADTKLSFGSHHQVVKDEQVDAGTGEAALALDQMPEPVLSPIVPLLDAVLIEVTPIVRVEAIYILALIGCIQKNCIANEIRRQERLPASIGPAGGASASRK